MTTAAILRLVLQGLVFIVWAIFMYQMLFTIRRRNEAETGGTFPSSGGFLAQLKYYFTSDEDRQSSRTLIFLTVVLILMTLSSALLA